MNTARFASATKNFKSSQLNGGNYLPIIFLRWRQFVVRETDGVRDGGDTPEEGARSEWEIR